MYTILKDGAALAEGCEEDGQGAVRWVPFAELVKESGTPRSFARLPSLETAGAVAVRTGGKVAEVLTRRGSDNFEIALYRPAAPPQRPVRASGR